MERRSKTAKKAEDEERLLSQLGFVRMDGETQETWHFALSTAGDVGVAVRRDPRGGFEVCWHLTDDDGARHYSLQEHADTVDTAVSSALYHMSGLGVDCVAAVHDLLRWNDVGTAIRKEFGDGRKD